VGQICFKVFSSGGGVKEKDEILALTVGSLLRASGKPDSEWGWRSRHHFFKKPTSPWTQSSGRTGRERKMRGEFPLLAGMIVGKEARPYTQGVGGIPMGEFLGLF